MSRVGLDIDGVLADFVNPFIRRTIGVTGKNLFPPQPFEPTVWLDPEDYGYTKQEVSQVWESIKQDPDFWRYLIAYPAALDLLYQIRHWRRDMHDVYFITSRPGQSAKWQTEGWLEAYSYGKPTVLISSAKGLCAQALKLDLYIDDKWENCVDTAPHCKTYLLSQPWNIEQAKDAAVHGIAVIRTLQEFVEILKQQR